MKHTPLAFLGCVFLCAPTQAQSDPPLFHGAQYPLGSGPSAVATADFDGDGALDLVVSKYWPTGAVYLLRGNGEGAVGPATTFPSAAWQTAIEAADVNSDGTLDLVTVSEAPANVVSTLLGNGQGGFGPAISHPVPGGPLAIALGDLNGDGALDVVTANFDSNQFSVLLGNGAGGFAPAANFPSGPRPASVVLGDWDGDLDLDLAVACFTAARLDVHLGDGQGGFSAATAHAVGNFPSTLVTADFDADGELDLAVTNQTSHTVSRLLGDGSGGFSTAVHFPAGSEPYALAAGDLGGDGHIDLIVTNIGIGNHRLSVLSGDGSGSFGPPIEHLTGTSPQAVALGDLNGDGALDAAVANGGSNSVAVLLGDGSGAFPRPIDFMVGGNARAIAAADLDSDGNPDLVVGVSNQAQIVVMRGDGHGSFGAPQQHQVGDEPLSIAISDLDADGDLDLVVGNYWSFNVSVLLGDGTGAFAPAVSFPVPGSVRGLRVFDWNSDGHQDILVAHDGWVWITVLYGDGQGSFPPSIHIGWIDSMPYDVAPGDFDHDGLPEVAVTNNYTQAYPPEDVYLLHADAQGNLASQTPFTLGISCCQDGERPWSITSDDVNADGHLDLAVACYNGTGQSTLSAYVMVGNGAGGFTSVRVPQDSRQFDVDLADADGDGFPDLLTTNHQSGSLSVVFGDGQGGFDSRTGFGLGGTSYSFAVADFNRDGNLDVAAAMYIGMKVSLLLNQRPALCSVATYGTALPNSAGGAAQLHVTGEPSLGTNAFDLKCAGLPAGVPGLFFFGTQRVDPGLPFGNGLLLVGGSLVRLPVVTANAGGSVVFAADFNAHSSLQALVPGDRRYFQFWYRDPMAGGAGFNTSNGLEVRFCN